MTVSIAGMSRVDRRLVVGVAITTAVATVSGATFNYIITPLTQDLDATERQISLLRQLPSIGALLVIFLAGAWGLRVGARRVIVGCALMTAVGYAIVSVAPVMAVASFGMLLGSIGKQGLFVLAFGLLAAKLSSDDDRATGFAILAAVTPFVYIVAPVIATLVLTNQSWRSVTLMWAVVGVLGAVAARRLLPPDDAADLLGGEMWTPAVAGLGLAAVVQSINNGSYSGWSAPGTLVWLAVAALSFAVLWVLMTRLAHPTLDLTILKNGGVRLLLLVVALVPFTNMWYYATVGFQYVYGYDAVQSALVMVPAQIAGLVGAWLAGRWIQRRGIRFAGTAMMVVSAVSLFLSAATTTTEPTGIPLLVLCLYSAAVTGTGIPLTNAIMNLAPRGGEGDASALRGAAGSLGAALGVVLMSTVVFTAYESSLGASLTAAGQDPEQVSQIAETLEQGVSSEEIAAQMAVPLETVEAVDAEQEQAMVDGYRAHGLVGGVVALLSAGVFFLNRRGLTGDRADTAQSTGSSD